MTEIAASVLNADRTKWKEWLPQLEKAEVDRIQFDIMDNKYVPNTGVPKEFISELRPHTKIFFETHLMVEKPEDYIREFAKMGSQLIIFHVETTDDPLKIIKKIKAAGCQVGIAINNRTPAQKIFPYLKKVDLALVMGVEAGFGGQQFNNSALNKILLLKDQIYDDALQCAVEIDGGINAQNAKTAIENGADVLVAGTAIFGSPKGISQAVEELRRGK
ncbi:MAG TPA: ribulose-phosphate 3-epimerase [archaeon]|nr:ribulose-phosphate 3-epimerase [archaeon]